MRIVAGYALVPSFLTYPYGHHVSFFNWKEIGQGSYAVEVDILVSFIFIGPPQEVRVEISNKIAFKRLALVPHTPYLHVLVPLGAIHDLRWNWNKSQLKA
jgi:hypothetical protein